MESEAKIFPLALQVAGVVIAAFGLCYVIRKHVLEWGVKIRLIAKTSNRPPVELEVVNLSRVSVQLKTLRVRRHNTQRTIKEFPLDHCIPDSDTRMINIHGQLNEYIWEKKIPSTAGFAAQGWQEQDELLDISLDFDSRPKAGKTRWVPIKIVIEVHPTFGSRVDRVEPI